MIIEHREIIPHPVFRPAYSASPFTLKLITNDEYFEQKPKRINRNSEYAESWKYD